ncbi:hypothetical protein Plhal304r1_c019g0067841 [Plasmopara halstedii]
MSAYHRRVRYTMDCIRINSKKGSCYMTLVASALGASSIISISLGILVGETQ